MSLRKTTFSSGMCSGTLMCVASANGTREILGLATLVTAGQVCVAKEPGGPVAEHLIGYLAIPVRLLADGIIAPLALVALVAVYRKGNDDAVPDAQLAFRR
jgi:hypothetical protein